MNPPLPTIPPTPAATVPKTPAPATAPAATVPPPESRLDLIRIQVAATILAAQVQSRGPIPLNQVQDCARRIMARTALDFADILIELDAT